MTNTVAIIQARMGSSRFPNKTLKPIAGQPLIGFLVDRLGMCKSLSKIVIATTVNKRDDQLSKWAKSHDIPSFRGSEKDVLNRFYKCASQYNADVIVRITADDPLKDPEVVDRAVNIFNSDDYDYVSNTINPSFPEGIDVEVFSFSALSRAENEAKKESEREHVTPYIWSNPKNFSIKNFIADNDDSDIRLTVDYPSDLKMLNNINRLCDDLKSTSYLEVVNLLRKNKEIMDLNNNIVRNEGYLESIKKEQFDVKKF